MVLIDPLGDNNVDILSICSGVGGLDLGLRLAVPTSRTVCYVENEAYCCEILVRRMEEKCLDEAPIWTDIKTFDGKPWRGKVDCIIGGYPCQPFSVAGQKAGKSDERYLWPELARTIREIQPSIIFLENVPGHLSLGFWDVLADLHSGGFDVVWDCFPAGAFGSHFIGDRLFVLADRSTATGVGWERRTFIPRGPYGKNEFERLVQLEISNAVPAGSRGRISDGVPSRVDKLRALGNAVIPLVGAYAFASLWKELKNQ